MGRSDDRPRLPTGTITFLFTDIEGSTRLLQDLGDRYGAVRDEHAAIRCGLQPPMNDRCLDPHTAARFVGQVLVSNVGGSWP
jgi:hypothetical protein